mmetsp:Transcript_21536/g.46805  ORF Transcript_21536/g.46805 Transcript_21536/m.46805 type:complete len:98 (+) Transcript_21536:562-855(+)
MPKINEEEEAVEVEVVETRVVIQGGSPRSSSVPVEAVAARVVPRGNILRRKAPIVQVEAVEVRVMRGSLPRLPKATTMRVDEVEAVEVRAVTRETLR